MSSQTLALLRGIVTNDGGRAKRVKEKRQKTRGSDGTYLCLSTVVIVVVSYVSEADREGTIDATIFRIISFSHLDLARSGIFLPPWTNSIKVNLAKQKGKCQIEVGSI